LSCDLFTKGRSQIETFYKPGLSIAIRGANWRLRKKIKTGKLKRLFGANKVKMADPETVERVTGYPVGGVCPVALPDKLPILLDETMHRFPVVYAAAGTPNSALPMTMEQLQRITGGQWADLV
jgi:prolyl-tRNA editing enzyme YbaK/EbsC (Cys-tRNA(Pro) deacylase)